MGRKQKREFLTRIARREINLTMALTKADACYDATIDVRVPPIAML